MEIASGPFERGIVLPVAVVPGQTKASYRDGLVEVILPRDNEKDLSEVPQQIRDELEFIFAENVDEVLKQALQPAAVETKS
jgi:ATP-dependent Lon protease